jgi:hypothetical protein
VKAFVLAILPGAIWVDIDRLEMAIITFQGSEDFRRKPGDGTE